MEIQTIFLLIIYSSCCFGILERKKILSASKRSSVCNDGTDAVYYIETSSTSKWVVFLESGGACNNFASCSKRIHKEPHLTGSRKYPTTVIGEDILSRNPKENFAYDFNKVLIPYCSSDLWLGNATVNFSSDNKNLYIHFRGYQILVSIFQDLQLSGLVNASEILLAGSSAGGIGAINQAKSVTKIYKGKVSVLTDSSWFINYNDILSGKNTNLFMRSIGAAGMIPSCIDRTYGFPCCLSIFCMVTQHHLPSNVQLFSLISRNDIYLFSRRLFTPQKQDMSTDIGKVISDMLFFSGEISHSVRLTNSFKNVHTIVTSCIQHTFLATSSLWTPGGLFYNRSMTSLRFPTFIFNHFVKKGIWNQVSVEKLKLQQILANWYNAFVSIEKIKAQKYEVVFSGKVEDSCTGIQCNPSCPRSIIYRTTISNWSRLSQWMMVLVYLSLTLFCLFMKLFWIIKRLQESKIQSEFLYSLYRGSNYANAIGLPCCIPSNYVGLSCKDVGYTVAHENSAKDKSRGIHGIGFRKSKTAVSIERREILKDVNAYFNPGQLVAIMGPSGSGKTTLLDILTGRKGDFTSQGNVYINGLSNRTTRDWFKRHSGYVMQLATPYHEELTVRQNLTFSAIMRLPRTMSTKNKLWRIEQVLGQAGLNECADIVVGNATGPGLSAGQKRRLCVAIQLLRVPNVLLLDEPTSGLDSASSLELLETLHGLTLSGRLVILTIHQPRIEIFHMFDRILFLCHGKVAYFGSPLMAPTLIAEALNNKGQVFDASNPADTIMDVLVNKKFQEVIVDFYKQSGEIEAIQDAILQASNNPMKTLSMKVKRYSSSFSDRMLALDSRASNCQTRAQRLYLLLIFILYGSSLGSVYWQTSSGFLLMSCYQVLVCASQLFMASVIHGHFSKALPVFSLEQAEGIGKSYELIIHSFIRVAALSFIPLLLCSVIIYLCSVVHLDTWKFFVTTLIHMQLNHVWIALIILSACTIPRYSTLICPMLSAISGFAGGFLVPKPQMPMFYYILFYINPTHWAYSAIMKILINDLTFECTSESAFGCQKDAGNAILQRFGFGDVEPYENMLVLLIMCVLLLLSTMALLELKYRKTPRFAWRYLRNHVHAISKRFTMLYHADEENQMVKEEMKTLVNVKDTEENGNCMPMNTSNAYEHPVHCKISKDITEAVPRDEEIASSSNHTVDFLSQMMPIKVQPMLTGRLLHRVRPSTISTLPRENHMKYTKLARSNTISELSRRQHFAKTQFQHEDQSNFEHHENDHAKIPLIKVNDNDHLCNNEVSIQGRKRSESSNSSIVFYSRYLDIVAKPHEVHCSLFMSPSKRSRKKKITKRLANDAQRSESVHIQRKASMLILAEKRKSMTAQITGFGQVFTYLNEAMEKPPLQMRKTASLGAKRKIETKKCNRIANEPYRSDESCGTYNLPETVWSRKLDLLTVPKPKDFEIKLKDNLLLSANTSDNVRDGNDETKGNYLVPFNERAIQHAAQAGGIGVSSRCDDNKEAVNVQKIIDTKKSNEFVCDFPEHRYELKEVMIDEPVKVSSLKISRKKLHKTRQKEVSKGNNYDFHDDDVRSVNCRSSLGSIDELDEDAGDSSTDEEITTARNKGRKFSLQQAQKNSALSKDLSVYYAKNSASQGATESVDFEAQSRNHPQPSDEVCRTSLSDRDRFKTESPAFADTSNQHRKIENDRKQMFAAKINKVCSVNDRKFPSHEDVSDADISSVSAFQEHENSDRIFDEKLKTYETDPQLLNDIQVMCCNLLDVNDKIAMATKSNEELTSLGYKQFNNLLFDCKQEELETCNSNQRNPDASSALRRSNSFEFDFETYRDNDMNDIQSMRKLRRSNKKVQMEQKLHAPATFYIKDNGCYSGNETNI